MVRNYHIVLVGIFDFLYKAVFCIKPITFLFQSSVAICKATKNTYIKRHQLGFVRNDRVSTFIIQ